MGNEKTDTKALAGMLKSELHCLTEYYWPNNVQNALNILNKVAEFGVQLGIPAIVRKCFGENNMEVVVNSGLALATVSLIDWWRGMLYRQLPEDGKIVLFSNLVIDKPTIANNDLFFWTELTIPIISAFINTAVTGKNFLLQANTYAVTLTLLTYHGFYYIERVARGMSEEEDWLYGKLLCTAAGYGSKEDIELFFNYVDFDKNYINLLEDRIKIAERSHDDFSLQRFSFTVDNYAANKQQVIKEVVNSLEPLNQKLVEFASFYVPYNLDEKALRDFLNQNNEYSPAKFGIEGLHSLHKALTGQNLALLKGLREFFVAEGQTQHGVNAAGYVGYMFRLAAEFAKQYSYDLNDALHKYDYKNTKFIMTLIDKGPSEREQMKFHLHSDFDAPVDKVVNYLKKISNFENLNNAANLTQYVNNNTPWQDAANLYNQASNFISSQMPNLPYKLEAYFANIYRNLFDIDLQKYIHSKAQNASAAAFAQAHISMADVLPANYWLAQVQSQGFYFIHNLLSNEVTELSQPIIYTVIAYRSALAGQPKETESYLTKAKDYLQQDEAFDMLAKYGEFYFNARNDFDNYLADFAASNASDVNDWLIKYQVLSLWNAFQITHSVNTLLCQATHTSWGNLLKDERDSIVASSVIIKTQLNDMQQYAQKLCIIEENQLAKFSCELTQGMHKASLYTAQQILGVLGYEEYKSTAAQLSLLQQEALHYQAIKQLQDNIEELKQSDDTLKALWQMAKGLYQGNLINTIYVKHSLRSEYQQECALLELLQADDSLKMPELCDNI